jgi:hypothetical protein
VARCSELGWDTMLQAGRSRVRFPKKSLDFSIDIILSAALCSGVDSAANRNEYQESSWRKRGPAHKADNLTAMCEPIVQKMSEPRRLTTLWASTAFYKDTFIFFYKSWGVAMCFLQRKLKITDWLTKILLNTVHSEDTEVLDEPHLDRRT